MKLSYGTLALVAVAALVLLTLSWGLPWTVPRIAGLAIAIPSLLLFVLARIQLGRAFSVRAKASTLVTSGIYSRIRNPIYLFGSLMIAGIILWMNRPWLLLFLAVLVPLQAYRIRKEERVLAEKFGTTYLEYKQRTWF